MNTILYYIFIACNLVMLITTLALAVAHLEVQGRFTWDIIIPLAMASWIAFLMAYWKARKEFEG